MHFREKFKKLSLFSDKYNGLGLKEIFVKNTKAFCQDTTLHGLKYVVDNKLRPSERCFFGVSVITVIVAAIYLINHVYGKWSTTPVIVGINPEPTFIANEPFPAVTICNLNQALDDVAKKFSRNSTEYTILQLLCKRSVNTSVVMSVPNWNIVEKFIIKISQRCQDMLIDCRFGGQYYNCSHLFTSLVTDEGFCCVFNMLHPKYMYISSNVPETNINFPKRPSYKGIDWYSEMGYPQELPERYYPSKIAGVGRSLGLSVALDVEQHKYYCSSTSSVGFKVALHSPNETPNIHEMGVFIEPGKETKLRIKPEKTESDPKIRGVHKKFRHCLFHNEGDLKFFAHYTQRNCEMECVAEMSLKYCGCISFYMPKIYHNVSVCSINEAKCARAVRLGTYDMSTSCLDDCLPGCFEMNYRVDAFATKLARNGLVVPTPSLGNRNRSYVVKNVAIVHMYFKENSLRSHIRTEFIGISDFLSSIGGLMGLFLGFSFLSIAECIYYAVVRPWRSVREYQNLYKADNRSSRISSSLQRTKTRRSILKKRNGKCVLSPKLLNEHRKLFVKTKRVPYSISHGFDEPSEDELRYHYCG